MEFSNEELIQALQEALAGADKSQPSPKEFTTKWYKEVMGETSQRSALHTLKRIEEETGLIEAKMVVTKSPWGQTTVKGWRYVGDLDEPDEEE